MTSRIECIFFSEFHPTLGPKITYQVSGNPNKHIHTYVPSRLQWFGPTCFICQYGTECIKLCIFQFYEILSLFKMPSTYGLICPFFNLIEIIYKINERRWVLDTPLVCLTGWILSHVPRVSFLSGSRGIHLPWAVWHSASVHYHQTRAAKQIDYSVCNTLFNMHKSPTQLLWSCR